ncbi:ATP synthase F1 subunit gamma [Natranaerofaba carboxydovora]|uniref:ATP synthase F1 subunit gamma n=1 Tax=Natranaerofaba carboxydovora TaxID=2742683 RepID=UPI001F145312|nr:ATP synthase F1 subunit gamma [Natranaerofaba carboxydovora]UMZ75104.1 ATP synthase gamma chain [Natranaerofaba carboxydovora]
MQSTREIKRRISSVENTQKITRAMEMVAAAKLRRAQDRLERARPYEDAMRKSILRVINQLHGESHPLMEKNDTGEPCYLIVAADRGLCGGYNVNVVREANEHMEKEGVSSPRIISVGKRVRDFYKKRNYEVVSEYLDMPDNPTIEEAKKIAEPAMELFFNGEINELIIVYNEFQNALTQVPVARKLLPMEKDVIITEKDTEEELDIEEQLYAFEPSIEAILGEFLERYVENIVLLALLESKTSEHGARMTAMGNATNNADEMIEDLTKTYNRARQASITQEILEIVNGAEALE